MSIDLSGFADVLGEIEQSIVEAARPAAQAGAQVIYDQVKINVRKLKRKTGLLEESIYQAFDKKNSTEQRPIYGVSWNSKKAPHAYNVENGHWRKNVLVKLPNGKWIATKERLDTPVWVPAKSFLRNALDQQDKAAAAMETEFNARVKL